jgi:hypothetical protein
MNATNALLFAAFGSVMEVLPKLFPTWFPPSGADQSSCRALWLLLMGAVQVTIGVGFILRAHAAPAVLRVFASVPASEPGTLALPTPRALPGR